MKNSDEHVYNVKVEWSGGRVGVMSSAELGQKVEVATPPEFPGGVEGIWSPEHLFTAAVSSCFMTSFTAVAEFSKFDFEGLSVESCGVMGKEDGKFVMSKIILKPILTILDESTLKKAHRLLEKAEQICLISRSIKSEIVFEPDVKVLTLTG